MRYLLDTQSLLWLVTDDPRLTPHRDPFDRLIIAQAIEENLSIIGSDKIFDKYRIKRIW